MKKTIQMMKESGLFDSLVQNIIEKKMPKEAFECVIDEICAMDENFEDTFLNDIHEFGLNIIWDELMCEVYNKKHTQQEDITVSLMKKLIDLLESK